MLSGLVPVESCPGVYFAIPVKQSRLPCEDRTRKPVLAHAAAVLERRRRPRRPSMAKSSGSGQARGPNAERCMTDEFESLAWKTAKTYADAPHEYILAPVQPEIFHRFSELLKEN